MPDGAFLMDEQGNKSIADNGSQRLTLSNVVSNKELYKNGNDMAYGETFLFCIPKETAEQMDAGSQKLGTSIAVSMNVDRYNVFAASTNSSYAQPIKMCIRDRPYVVVTGAFAPLVTRFLRVPHEHDENLVLDGLRLIWEKNHLGR